MVRDELSLSVDSVAGQHRFTAFSMVTAENPNPWFLVELIFPIYTVFL